ncbi:K+-transporting ATPase, KdpA [Anaerolinea thermolimosa]|mgnify:CR=1 FL=1|uniref:potassium-transporting ATPase subunit KdpA n=1 Tax=Anaerolinea thermolimosa TaxID=229919 RepID=UPI000782D85C|nr:potassium-transporting ATPase subunit KdpA [Anaerolinea thermolimosa]GAP06042.1 K+-transporting ATPase, KdpA [Anaerolinea thermolimosa]
MNIMSWLQLPIYIGVLLILVKPLGSYMARVYQGERTFLSPVIAPIERFMLKIAGVKSNVEMTWKTYALTVLLFNLVGFFFLYLLLRFQQFLPLNPQALGSISPQLAFNTAVSFVTNTNWQSYSGETTMSYLSQALGLSVQNFLSAATGMAVLIALIQGLTGHSTNRLGNFWVDLIRSVLYILLPLSIILALLLVAQGVVQSFQPAIISQTVDQTSGVVSQTIPLGPAASQIAIKQLGTNGGGFYNVNSAHPFENPTPFSNFLEMLAILLIPAALTYTFGKMVGDTRQGWALLAAMTIILMLMISVTISAESQGNPVFTSMSVDQSGGNMEGKEVRFGVVNSSIWATVTASSSNGSVNTMLDSFSPLGGLVPMWMILLGEVVFGGVGSGLYGMLAFVVIAVFVAGLMVGRTPEYLGKKIGIHEMKMAVLIVLIPVITVLFGTAIALTSSRGTATIFNAGPQGFSEVLYAFASAGNNNGSAFAGLGVNTDFYNITLGIAMLFARYALIVPILAMAGSLAQKKIVPASSGTMPTYTLLFIGWLIGVIIIVGALSFLPALALGPIVQQLMMGAGRLF